VEEKKKKKKKGEGLRDRDDEFYCHVCNLMQHELKTLRIFTIRSQTYELMQHLCKAKLWPHICPYFQTCPGQSQ
jgi:hypothetical protein